jgi:hypothetical protein
MVDSRIGKAKRLVEWRMLGWKRGMAVENSKYGVRKPENLSGML